MSLQKAELIKPHYRPSVELQKERYWAQRRRMQMLERLRHGKPRRTDLKPIPDNSEPWLPHPARSVGELIQVMREMETNAKRWSIELTTS